MLEAIILGILQGLTEFLPVSSSGHLVIIPYLVPQFSQPPLAFGVAVHGGSLVAVIAYFWSDLKFLATRMFDVNSEGPEATARARKTVMLLGIGSIPAAALGLALRDSFETAFEQPQYAAAFLLVTGAILYAAETIRLRRAAAQLEIPAKEMTSRQRRLDPGRDEGTISVGDAIVIGLAQAFAIFPGVSRAGSTMAAGMIRGLSREGAARYSFLLSIPVILGAFILSIPDLTNGSLDESGFGGSALIAGMLAAAISGYWAIRFLLKLVATDDLLGFARYVVVLGTLTLFGYFTWIGPASSL